MNLIPELLLAPVVLCLCVCLGKGAFVPLYKEGRTLGLADALITGEEIIIGLAVAAHVAAVFTGQSFSRCAILFLILVLTALVTAGGLLVYGKLSKEKGNGRKDPIVSAEMTKATEVIQGNRLNRTDREKQPDQAEKFLSGLFVLMAFAQLAFVLWNTGVYTQGDMTAETVGSFIQTDSVYLVDPMTGQPYAAGMPTRLKILCLPALYGFFCKLTGLQPDAVVTTAVPAMVFVSSYAAFYCVGASLFPDSGKKRSCFLITIVILMWVGSYMYGIDGFNLLYCGYRGVTIRNLVLIPYLISLCIRKKWKLTVLCILAEACIVWTLYGLGICLPVAVGLYLAGGRKQNGGAS